ncbi:MAG: MFS transporter [Actinobacteria bacterium]|nr:MFS transporter [Actinomycetota bacterium]
MQTAVVPGLPEIERSLHTSPSTAGWLTSGFLLSAAVSTPVVGRLGDMLGKRRMLLWILGVLAVGTLLCALAPNVQTLIAGRVIQGVSAGVMPLSFSIIRHSLPARKVPGALGILSALLGVGGCLGLVLSAVVVSQLSWQWLFWLTFPMAAAALAAVLLAVPDTPTEPSGRFSVLSLLLMSAFLVGLLVAITEVNRWGATSLTFIGLVAIAVAFAVLWVFNELRVRVPLVDVRLMRRRAVLSANLSGVLLGFGLFGANVLVPALAAQPRTGSFGFGYGVIGSGLLLLPSALCSLAICCFVGRLESRFGSRDCLLVGCLVTAGSYGLLGAWHSAPLAVAVSTGFLGIGIGVAYASMINLVVQSVPPDNTGVATGVNAIARTVGGSIGTQLTLTLLTNGTSHPTDHGFAVASYLTMAMLGVAFLSVLAVPNRARIVKERLSPEAAEVSRVDSAQPIA